jgi:hypothetical protein
MPGRDKIQFMEREKIVGVLWCEATHVSGNVTPLLFVAANLICF